MLLDNYDYLFTVMTKCVIFTRQLNSTQCFKFTTQLNIITHHNTEPGAFKRLHYRLNYFKQFGFLK